MSNEIPSGEANAAVFGPALPGEESDSTPAGVLLVAAYIQSQHKGRLHSVLGVLLAAVTTFILHKLLYPLLPILLCK